MPSEMKRINQLEEENARLKRIVREVATFLLLKPLCSQVQSFKAEIFSLNCADREISTITVSTLEGKIISP